MVDAPGSELVGDSLSAARFRRRHDATVLALRRGPGVLSERMDRIGLQAGDTLLVQATADTVDRFTDYLRVGGPLWLVFAVVTTRGIAAIWGV